MIIKPMNCNMGQSMINHTIMERTMVHKTRDSNEKQNETGYLGNKNFREMLEEEIMKLRYFV